MNRIFGSSKKKKEAPPAMSLDEVSEKMTKKSGHMETKIAGLEKQVLAIKKKMKIFFVVLNNKIFKLLEF